MFKGEIADKIKLARKKANMTQAEAASAVGIKKQTISDYERGRTRIPSDMMKRLCLLYNIPIGDILVVDLGSNDNQEICQLMETKPGLKNIIHILKNAPDDTVEKAALILRALLD